MNPPYLTSHTKTAADCDREWSIMLASSDLPPVRALTVVGVADDGALSSEARDERRLSASDWHGWWTLRFRDLLRGWEPEVWCFERRKGKWNLRITWEGGPSRAAVEGRIRSAQLTTSWCEIARRPNGGDYARLAVAIKSGWSGYDVPLESRNPLCPTLAEWFRRLRFDRRVMGTAVADWFDALADARYRLEPDPPFPLPTRRDVAAWCASSDPVIRELGCRAAAVAR